MARITVVPDDDMVLVDGKAWRVDCSSVADDVHAIQWNGESGHIEYKQGAEFRPSEPIDSIAQFQALIDAWDEREAIANTPPEPETEAERQARLDAIAGEMDVLESVTRAAVLVIMDELNRHSSKITELGQAIAGASSLANIRSRVAAIDPIPQRSADDLKAAIRDNLG